MDSETEKILRASGWTPDRNIDSRHMEEVLRTEGYELSPPLLKLIRSFGELRVRFSRRRPPGAEDYLDLDPVAAVGGIYRERVMEDYEPRTGAQLVPIGEAFSGHMVLLVDQRGRVFGAYDDVLMHWGDSFDGALRKIFSDEQGEIVP